MQEIQQNPHDTEDFSAIFPAIITASALIGFVLWIVFFAKVVILALGWQQ